MEKFDFIIIGGGSAAVSAALKAGEFGARIALVEAGDVGGTCANISCVPTKNLLRDGEVVHMAKQKNLRSIKGAQSVSLNFAQAVQEAGEVVEVLRQQKYDGRLRGLRRFFQFHGRAVFTGSHQIEVNGVELFGTKFLIATGSSTSIPEISGLKKAGYLTHAEIMGLTDAPSSLIIIGAGPLGLEFAQMFVHFGTRVRVIQRGPRILPRVEPEIAEAAAGFLEEDGIVIHTDEAVLSVDRADGDRIVTVKTIGLEQKYRAQEVMMAVGRVPNTAGLGLEEIGVKVDKRGAIIVNDEFATSLPHIYAAGDVCGEPMLASVAIMEGRVAAGNAMGGERRQIDYDAIPSCTFTHPEVAQVGLTESAAVERGHQVEARTLSFGQVPRAQILRDTRGLIKMVAEKATGRILGCAIVSPHAGDLINEAGIVIKCKMSVDEMRDAVHAYPTLSEALVMVADEFARPQAAPAPAKKKRKAA
ncbi:MAG: mercury(II) reductase [Actinomycetota bacterium]|nr:mercury(II) reductase [Actinomycetota bacterium]